MFAYNLLSSLLRAIGNSAMTLVFLIISSVLNVILDFALVAGAGMGVRAADLVCDGPASCDCILFKSVYPGEELTVTCIYRIYILKIAVSGETVLPVFLIRLFNVNILQSFEGTLFPFPGADGCSASASRGVLFFLFRLQGRIAPHELCLQLLIELEILFSVLLLAFVKGFFIQGGIDMVVDIDLLCLFVE